MLQRLSALAALAFGLLFCLASAAHAQNSSPVDPDDLEVHVDGWNRPIPRLAAPQKSAPAPRRDISGTWEPAEGWRNGVQAQGAYNYPMDGKHPLPYTPEGEKAWKEHKYGDGFGSYPLAEVNDPFKMCDPIGFPRIDLHDLRAIQIVPTALKTLIVYENDQVWRSIWTDGRDFPRITEPRWYGYSIGKWADDYTFVVETMGLDERTWIDNAGRPHTKDLKVEERFHRVNRDLMELTLTIDDPKYYSKPWNALDKYPLRLQTGSFDIREMVCSESEAEIYNKEIADEAAAQKKEKGKQ